jgi:hypothetical protein
MSSYMIERELPDGLSIPQDEGGVTWVHSYVCIYDGPAPEAVRLAGKGA